MEIRQLKTFKKVVELRNFSKTAKELNYGQSTVTEHIQILEREIGTPLFDRLGKKIRVTSVGKELYGYVVELLDIHNKIKNISIDKDNLNGHIAIGASESIIVYRLQPVLSRFRENYPNVNITLISDHCSKLKEKLYTGQVDLTITLEPAIDNKDLVVNRVNEEPLVFISGLGNNVEKISVDNKDEISKECIIFTEKECALRRFFENYLYNKSITPISTLEFSTIEAIKQCVASELGISLLPEMCVKDLIRDKKVKIIGSEDQEIKFLTQLAYHKNKWLSPLLKEFMKYSLESLSNF
ncbi:LysR family transcriptional regulator [Crassaminicella profunda]|uniref:LysR family transcriptional regulator n=1 Tax=Crassaminicella profunda TaxID=1286698 RepID=UPI001CA6ED5E|nr:LysR family transcriptional regulator [Crassaminicella profunda]QZY54536.1 LysR family transcriptional regulator [Crassaminicella profunda]